MAVCYESACVALTTLTLTPTLILTRLTLALRTNLRWTPEARCASRAARPCRERILRATMLICLYCPIIRLAFRSVVHESVVVAGT